MSDQPSRAPRPARTPARTPAVAASRTTVWRSGVRRAAATLVWSGLFYSAVTKHAATNPTASAAAHAGKGAAAKSLTPVTTRSS